MLTRDEQRVLHAFGGFLGVLAHEGPMSTLPGWPLTGGGTLTALGRRGWLDYNPSRIWFHYPTESDPQQLVLAVKWPTLQGHAQGLPPDLLTRLREHQRRQREHQGSFRSYPNRAANPKGWTEADAYFRDVHMPEFRDLSAERRRLLDECYPLAVDHEPTDLLELLAVEA